MIKTDKGDKYLLVLSGLMLLFFVRCKSDARRVATVFISHIIRLEYKEAAVYADDSTALHLKRLAAEVDTTADVIREFRTYKQKFSLERISNEGDTVRFRWCCHADSTKDSLELFLYRGRWRVSWRTYVPIFPEDRDTLFRVEYVY